MSDLSDAIRRFEDDVEKARGYPIKALELSNLIASQVWGARMHHEGIGYVTPHRNLVSMIREPEYGLFEHKEIEVDGRRIARYAISMYRYHPFKATSLFYDDRADTSQSFDWTQFAAALSGFYVQNELGLEMKTPALFAMERVLDRDRTRMDWIRPVAILMYPVGWVLMKTMGDKIKEYHDKHEKIEKSLGRAEKTLDRRQENAFAYTLLGNYSFQTGDQVDQYRGNILGMHLTQMHIDGGVDLNSVRLSDIIREASDEATDLGMDKASLKGESYKEDYFFGLLRYVRKREVEDGPHVETGKEKAITIFGNVERAAYNTINRIKLAPYHRKGWK